jgi:hypothetical protein
MARLATLFLLFSTLPAQAVEFEQAEEVFPFRSQCWQAERFESEEAYRMQAESWQELKQRVGIRFPGPFDALTAYQVVQKETDFAQKHFKNDKKVHCYFGCRIAQETNFSTARWAGWEKERRDLQDCDSSTRFELADYEATFMGAEQGLKFESPQGCLDFCAIDP